MTDDAATKPTFEQRARELEQALAPQLEGVKARLAALNDEVKSFVRANPGTSLLGAVAVGFVVGKLASRRWGRD